MKPFFIYFIITVLCGQFCYAEKNKKTDIFINANQLFLNDKIAEAAVEYTKAVRDPYLSPQDRVAAQDQLEKCMQILRLDHKQTDKFYSLISQQKDNRMMQYLMYQYASLLESQGRFKELIKIYRTLYRLYPSSSQKYTLARKLQRSGAVEEAFALYEELLEDKQYHRIALRHILENISRFGASKSDYLDEILRLYEKEITVDFQLFNLVISALINLKKSKQALEYSFKIAPRFPPYIDTITSTIYREYKSGNIDDNDLKTVIKEYKNRLTDEQRYFIAKIYGRAGEYNNALNILGASIKTKMLEYRAQLLYSSGSYEQAKRLYKIMTEKNKPREMWLIKLAEISFKLGKDDAAVKYLDDYINLKGNTNFNTYLYVGKILERYGLAEKAKQVYLKGKELSHNKTYAAYELIKYYINQKKFYDAAYEIFESERTQKLAPKSIYQSLSYSLKDQAQIVELMEYLEQIITDKQSEQPLTPEELSNLYYCIYSFYFEIGDIKKAIKFFKVYFGIAPDNHNKLIEFCGWLEIKGFYKETIELLSYIPETSPFFRQATAKRAEIMILLNESEKAVELLEKYPDKKNNFLLATALYNSGSLEQSKKILRQVFYKDPRYYLLEGDIFLMEHDLQGAVGSYKHITGSAGNTYSTALFRIALANLFYGKYNEAVLFFGKIIKVAPASRESFKSLKYRTIMALLNGADNKELLKKYSSAEFLLWSGKTDEAVQLYKQIIGFNPKQFYVPELRLLLYQVYFSSNDNKNAVEQLEKIVSDFPDSPYAPMADRLAMDLKSKISSDFNIAEEYSLFLNLYPKGYDSDIIRSELNLIEQTDNN
ncbi:tetratricopeptide repeat protein [bacterium]|nr:tetratricopeptide repeat protein [bacterium]